MCKEMKEDVLEQKRQLLFELENEEYRRQSILFFESFGELMDDELREIRESVSKVRIEGMIFLNNFTAHQFSCKEDLPSDEFASLSASR